MLANKVALGALLMGGAQLVMRALDLIQISIVARFLTPEDFGLVALANGVMLILAAATDVHVSDALIQRKTITKEDLDTGFTLGLLRGLAITGIVAALAWPMSSLYGDPRLLPVMLVLSLAPFAATLFSPAISAQMHQLDYRAKSLCDIVGKLTTFVVAVAFAIATQSYWALILGAVASTFVTSALSYALAPYRIRLGLKDYAHFLKFGVGVGAARALVTVNQQLDRFFVGGIMGKGALGQYSIASSYADAATWTLAGPLMGALFSGFARVKEDIERLRRAYLHAQQLITALVFPSGVLLGLVAVPFSNLLLTEAWHSVPVVLAWTAAPIAFSVISASAFSFMMAVGAVRKLVEREVLALLVKIPAVIVGTWFYGIEGAAIAVALSTIAMTFITINVPGKALGLTLWRQMANCGRSFLSAALMAVAVRLVLPQMAAASDLVQVLVCVAVGVSVYVLSHCILWMASGRPDGAESYLRSVLLRRLT